METTEKKVSHTPGPWHINHWSQGESGIRCIGEIDGITYYSGDAVMGKRFGIRSKLKHNEHSIVGSFEGAHICDIEDFSNGTRHNNRYNESEANAKLIAAAPELLEALQMVLEKCDGVTNPPCYIDNPLFLKVRDAIKKATE